MVKSHRSDESKNNSNPSKINTHFMKKIPQDAEANNILVGEVEFLDRSVSAFLRLNNAVIIGNLTEVPIPTK